MTRVRKEHINIVQWGLTIFNDEKNVHVIFKQPARTTPVLSFIRLSQLSDGHKQSSTRIPRSKVFNAVFIVVGSVSSCFYENVVCAAFSFTEQLPASR